MSRIWLSVFSVMAALIMWNGAANANESPPASSENVTVRLASDLNGVAPGGTVHVALVLEHNPGWHTYWRNPGDSGEATQITWTLPEGVEAGEIIWPAPEAIPVEGILTNYGFEDETLLVTPVSVPDTAQAGDTLTLVADLYWLECELICIPVEGIVLSLDVAVSTDSQRDPVWGPRIDAALAEAPQLVDIDAGLRHDGDTVALSLQDAAFARAVELGEVQDVRFFPFSNKVIDHNAAQDIVVSGDTVAVTLTPMLDWSDAVTAENGVIGFTRLVDGAPVHEAFEIAAAPTGSSSAAGGAGPVGSDEAALGLPVLLLFALVGGLILNLMPCVFPVLSMKAAGFVGKAHDQAGEIRRHGLLFLAGVLTTFAILGIALAGLQASLGGAVYGAWLQNPLLVSILAVIVFLIGLNLLGFFEIGTSLQGVGSGLAAQGGNAGAFFTGVLAVVVGAPCIGPFLGVGLGAAFTQPAPIIVLFFLLMGVGLAAPFVALSMSPGLFRKMPRPGPWMDKTKQVLAFPMFVTVVWLVWTVGGQAGENGVGFLLLALTASAFLVWAFTELKRGSVQAWFARGVGGVATVLALLGVSASVLVASDPVAAQDGGSTDWSPQRVAELQDQGYHVFVDFTAKWCVTCQANKATTLNRDVVRDAFAAHDVVFLTADWTNRNDEIAQELNRYGRAGVPLYLLHSKDGDVEILPQTLTPAIVIDAVERL